MKNRVMMEILAERIAQDAQWGGPPHDDAHCEEDWPEYIEYQLDKLEASSSYTARRSRIIKIAALAVAAVESMDRKERGIAQ